MLSPLDPVDKSLVSSLYCKKLALADKGGGQEHSLTNWGEWQEHALAVWGERREHALVARPTIREER